MAMARLKRSMPLIVFHPLLQHLSPVPQGIIVIRQRTGIIDSSIASNHWIPIMLEVESVGLIYQHGCPLLHRTGIPLAL